MRLPALVTPAVLGLLLGPAISRANLALSLNSHASISALSAQLLAKPRSQAGNKVNVWDCDPPLAAVAGLHYFAYNLDASDNPLPQGSLVMTMRAARFGPGYDGNLEVLARNGPGQPTQWVQRNTQTQLFDLSGMQELGLARVTFNQTGLPGFITEDFDVELDYDAQDINHQFANDRGFEHARFATEYLDHSPAADDAVARGMMTPIVPAAYAGLAPPGQPFAPGFLDFGNDNIAFGLNVFTATVATDPLAQTWISTNSGDWEDPNNWQDGTIANGANHTARFDAIDQTSTVTVPISSPRTVGHLKFADYNAASAGSYRLLGSVLTLAGTSPSIDIGQLEANSRARIDNVINCDGGLIISGTNVKGSAAGGGLWLTAANTWSGGTTINNATVYLGEPINAISPASFGSLASTVVLNGNNFILNATTGAAGGIVLNHNFVAGAGSVTSFALGNRADFGIPSGLPINIANQRTVTGSGTIALTGAATGADVHVYSNFTAFTGRLIFNGSGVIQLFNTGGFVGSGFGNAAVTLNQSAVLAFQTAPGSATVNFGSLDGTSATAGINPSSSGPAILTIGLLNTNTTFNGFIAGANRVTKVGTGTLTLGGNNTYTGPTTILGGSLVLSGSAAQAPVLGVSVGGADIRQGTSLVLRYVGGASPAPQVQSILAAGYNQPTRFLTGNLRSVGIPANRALGFRDDGANSEVTIAFTAYGDANLDLTVGFADLVLVAQNYNLSGKSWAQGDFTYDGNVNFNDLVPLAQNYGQSLSVEELGSLGSDFAADWALAMSLVPEPGGLSLFALGAAGSMRRRR